MREWMKLCEGLWWDDSPTMTLYHGTSSAFLDIIKTKGLLPPEEDIRAYALNVLREYLPDESKWTPELLADIERQAVRPDIRKGDFGAAIYFMSQDNQSGPGVRGYARSYAEHGGEIAYCVWDSVCSMLEPEKDHFDFNFNPPIAPRFAKAKPIIVKAEVPKSWIITSHDIGKMKANCQELWSDGVEWAREAGSLTALYNDVFDDREVRVTRTIPPEMITAIYSVEYGDMDDAGRGKPL